ncbi:6-phosphogluconolactonase [Klebsormidium nitens]|uniref:6-phosphogluconolactonase n=1 Tax=Klebsormidium nitens TaxID=105231 RepID=A0A1Y1IS64_KLENI|nr:6-phosphogluconolactonase [Klebsormidium nitens]|eukprot:GAQ91586.1 6-phosphogluconolactonase [Klebsormidium nitens]
MEAIARPLSVRTLFNLSCKSQLQGAPYSKTCSALRGAATLPLFRPPPPNPFAGSLASNFQTMAEQRSRITLPPFAAPQKSSGAATKESDKVQNADNGALASGEPKKEPVPGKDFPAHLFPYPEGYADVSLERILNMPQLQRAVAAYVKEASAAAIKEKGAFTVVLSGGSLVKGLSSLIGMKGIDWSKWHVFWADERVVKLTDPDSNYKLATDEFLSKVDIPDNQIYALNDTLGAKAAAADYEKVLKNLPRDVLPLSKGDQYPRFDLILLGIGPDGHIASLFPNHPLVGERAKWVAHITDSPKPPPQRITLTLPVINSAKQVAFVVTGQGKAEVLQRILEVSALPGALPAQLVRPTDGSVTWFADLAATAELNSEAWADAKKFPRNAL